MKTTYLTIIFLLGLAACGQKNQQVEQTAFKTDTVVNKYFHKDVIIGNLSNSYPKGIKGKKAALFGIKKLKERDIKDIQICVVSWIAAPVSGYLIDAKGTWKHKDQKFSVFRIGIRDGSEERKNKLFAGEEFVFIALGEDKSGEKIWYPPPGPDYEIKENKVVPEAYYFYEFLLERQDLENLDLQFK